MEYLEPQVDKKKAQADEQEAESAIAGGSPSTNCAHAAIAGVNAKAFAVEFANRSGIEGAVQDNINNARSCACLLRL